MKTRLVIVGAAASATLAFATMSPAGASDGRTPSARSPRTSTTVVDGAVDWLKTQQQADGGFEVSAFPGFETPDAILALAGAAQTGPGWSTSEARTAVEATTTGGGNNPLDSVDDWVDSVQGSGTATAGDKAQQAAKVIALVAVPLGLDATDFDPSDDSGGDVDLEAALKAAAGPSSDYSLIAAFTGQVFALWALAALDDAAVPASLVTAIEDAQQANGGFSFTGDPSDEALDPDVTGAAIVALALAGGADDAMARSLSLLGQTQTWTGDWASEFDSGNPNSTAMVMLAARSWGCDPDVPFWRIHAEPRLSGVPYPSPRRALERRQAGDGHIAGPGDAFGVNTFGTTQAVQAMVAAEGPWPYVPPQLCPGVATPESLVNAYYFDLLGRLTDEAGASYWLAKLEDGMPPLQVARSLIRTNEYGRRVTDVIVRAYLDHPATSVQKEVGAGLILEGRRMFVLANLFGSTEYFDLAGPTDDPTTNEEWVNAVFQDVLERPADTSGRTWALGLLSAGRTRTQVARALLGSTAALRLVVTKTYEGLLRRNPDQAGAAFWVSELRRGRSPEAMVAALAGSAEYVALTEQGIDT